MQTHIPSPNQDLISIDPESLGNELFREDYKVKFAYASGAMYKGIASKELVIAMAKSKIMSYFGAGGVRLDELETTIRFITDELKNNYTFGMNLLSNLENPKLEMETVLLYLKYGIRYIEAASFVQITPALVKYRLSGAKIGNDGKLITPNFIMAKISRPEVAEAFMNPPPERIVALLLEKKEITEKEAMIAPLIPVAQDICVEADSGGHTDRGNPYVLLPAIQKLARAKQDTYKYTEKLRVGTAGGIGTPEAAAAAFVLGADFIMTGSINQCTVESGTSALVKAMLQNVNVQDTGYAPAGDMFETGAKVQVVKRGLFFSSRANRLYDLYQRYNTIEELDENTKIQIENKYFGRSFDEVWNETKSYYAKNYADKLTEIEASPRKKMLAIFRWYFIHSTRVAMHGNERSKVDYQIHCGPAMGAFNQWVKNTNLENWQNRKVVKVAEIIMSGTADLLKNRLQALYRSSITVQKNIDA